MASELLLARDGRRKGKNRCPVSLATHPLLAVKGRSLWHCATGSPQKRLEGLARANFKKIARLGDEGQLSRAASRLYSVGPLDPSPGPGVKG